MNKLLNATALSVVLAVGAAGSASAAAVDTLLSLVIDVSGSIDNAEYQRQIEGYEAAFLASDVQSAILDNTGGRNGAVAVNVVSFSTSATESLSFSVLDDVISITDFASDLGSLTRESGIGNLTNIASGIDLAVSTQATWLNDVHNTADARVIDVSGDGERNEGREPSLARDDALNDGVDRINGLPIGGASLLSYYENNVIGGTDSFALQAPDFDAFDTAIARKLEAEIGGGTPPPIPLPAPAFLLLAGLGGLVAVRKSKKA